MSDDVNKDTETRGLGLQCPWSNCFPQLYNSRRKPLPCSNTQFGEFRELIDHIWKYHSFLLSCDKCIYRFSSAKRTENGREALNELKSQHMEKCHSDKSKEVPRSPRDSIRTMTKEQDESLRKWKAKNGKDKDAVGLNYISLCRSLFGNIIEVPTNSNPYFIPYYTTNIEYAKLGERNEAYVVQQRLLPTQLASTGGFDQQLTPYPYQYTTKDPLSLDEPALPGNWALPKQAPDQDSGYASGHPGVPALPAQANHGAYTDVSWGFNLTWPESDGNMMFRTTGSYFNNAMPDELPPFEVEPGDGSDEPIG
ncbi:hypothetical protein F4859DRAFT_417097 [Xylaria cf. heliscus]|nr:hypothetical protein F4859DRAFT_417097 [Xylaria cf. heliscus]